MTLCGQSMIHQAPYKTFKKVVIRLKSVFFNLTRSLTLEQGKIVCTFLSLLSSPSRKTRLKRYVDRRAPQIITKLLAINTLAVPIHKFKGPTCNCCSARKGDFTATFESNTGLRIVKLMAAATNDPTPTRSVILCVSKAALMAYPRKLQPPITIPTCFKLEPTETAVAPIDMTVAKRDVRIER